MSHKTANPDAKLTMRAAWRMARKGRALYGGKVGEYLPEALRIAWAGLKADPVWRDLDADFLTGVLGMDKSIFRPHGPMAVMRAKLAAEPSIRGHK